MASMQTTYNVPRDRILVAQVPLKYANSVTGASYVVSFGIGSALVTACVLAAYSVARRVQGRCAQG